ncbi:MAG: tetratricopeptide repeat protein [Spirochaetota bacterium]|nr:tetratricopeptide repeat protein [Spirochaetota bacterium]
MSESIKILNSKLHIPSSLDIIKRDRIYPLLIDITKKRLTTVIAGAGFGKTTLITEVCEYLNLETVWYRLDKSDSDFITFISYLIAGIKKYFSKFGIETHQRIEETRVLTQERDAVLTVFLSEIDKLIKGDLIIVLDDYHLIQDSQEINESLKFLLEHLSPLVHLIIISRTDIGLPISRLRAQRQVLDIREENLIFSIPEIEDLYFQLFNITLPNESLVTLQQKTDGWVSGLILFYHSLKWKSPDKVEELLLKLKGSHQMISDYLAENVYDLQPDVIKDFLIKTSILSRVGAEFCNQLLGINNSKDILSYLERNHLFTFSSSDERRWYYYHHLFQEYLNTKLESELHREDIIKLHNDAAILWEKRSEVEESIRHYLTAEQLGEACRLLKNIGSKLINEGRFQLISSYLKQIPESYMNKEPWIQYIQAQILSISGKPQEAIRTYQKAYKTFRKYDSREGTGLCMYALGSSYCRSGDFPRAERNLKRLHNQVKDNKPLYIDILGTLIFITSHLGKMTVADQYYKEAISLLDGSENKELRAILYFTQGFRYVFSGDCIKALEFGERAKEISLEFEFCHLLAMSYHLISWTYYYLGFFLKGLENAQKGLDLVRERGIRDSTYAWLLLDLSLNAATLGRITEAISDGKESLRMFQELGYGWGQVYAYYVLHNTFFKSGNQLVAEEYLISGLELVEGMTLPLTEGLLKRSLANILLDKGQWEKARPLLEDAKRLLRNSKLNLSRVYLTYARFYWEQRQREDAINILISALKLCKANQYDIWVVSEKNWIISLLVELFALSKMKDYLQRILDNIGLYAREELRLLQKDKNPQTSKAASILLDEIKKAPPPGLRVYCLGTFRVFRGDVEIPNERWKNKNAKMLFKYFIYARNRGYLSKEVLMELLWSERDPKKTIYSLHNALTSIRKTLEPEIKRGISSSYLLKEDDSYLLYLGEEGWVDVDEFLQELKLAKEEKDTEKSISHYLKAEATYRSDFLEEDVYAEWCFDQREMLKGQYLDLLMKLMKHFERKWDYSKCIEYARKYLGADKYAEHIYQQLMNYYSLTGNKTMLNKTYERCKDNILKELDFPLSKETEELYEELVSLT